jgi:hypothetical protein
VKRQASSYTDKTARQRAQQLIKEQREEWARLQQKDLDEEAEREEVVPLPHHAAGVAVT